MRIVECISRRHRRRSLLIAAPFSLFALYLVLHQLSYQGRLRKPSPRSCGGSEASIVERSEDYVQRFVNALSQEARAVDTGDEQLDLIFYGDSIAETWRGTDMGRDCHRCQGGPETFYRYFASRYTARIFAVGGDQTAHLQWRLLHGQLLSQNPPRVTVLMIGTNDLGADASCFGWNSTLALQAVNKAFKRIEGIVDFLRLHTPSSKVLLVGLTPRGVWSGEVREFVWPSVYTVPINALNHILRRLAVGDESVHYVDCGDELLGNDKIDERMQGDGLHPTPEGLAVLASCILSKIQGIIGPGHPADTSNTEAHDLLADPEHRLTPKETLLRDKLCFFLGLCNVALTAYWLGSSPQTWSNWYTVKALVLFTVRFFLYRRRKWSFYMLEFCYFANLLLLFEIWIFPQSALLHKVVFGLCAGPITFSIPALRNSLVLHSLDKTTSLFMHLAPAIMAWCLRWHPNVTLDRGDLHWFRSRVDESFTEASWWELTVLPMMAYMIWAILYYFKVFVISSDKIFKENYSNMYTLMVTNSDSAAARLVLKAPQRFQPAMYLLMHCLLCWIATLAAAAFWHSKLLHTFFLILCSATSAWNGATYFFDVFAHCYVDSVGLKRKQG